MDYVLVNNILNRLQPEFRVLFVWSGNEVPENFTSLIERVQKHSSQEHKVCVEHSDRIQMSSYETSSFDCIIANLVSPLDQEKNVIASFSLFLRLLRPKRQLMVCVSSQMDSFENELKLNGFTSIKIESSGDNLPSLVTCEKPNFEVGASSRLKFASKVTPQVEEKKQSTWKFTQDDIAEDDLINTDDLLDDLDLKKPTNINDKFDCGTSASGKKKACKNCSCGLAEELENEASDKQTKNRTETSNKSACGSCYLGDAFRCASCPYLGMPAFKPGEKIQLTNNLLNPDI